MPNSPLEQETRKAVYDSLAEIIGTTDQPQSTEDQEMIIAAWAEDPDLPRQVFQAAMLQDPKTAIKVNSLFAQLAKRKHNL